jgi:hypothetical protein
MRNRKEGWMTWIEWKTWIEAQGVKDDDTIAYINCSLPEEASYSADDGKWVIE